MALSNAERQKLHRERVKAKLATLAGKAKLATLAGLTAGNDKGPQLVAPADEDDWVELALALFDRMSREQKRRFAAEIVAGKRKRKREG